MSDFMAENTTTNTLPKQAAAEGKKKGNAKAMRLYTGAGVAAVIVLAAAYMLFGTTQTVAVGDNVSVYYTGTFTNGTVFGSNVGGLPLNFTVGAGQLIPGFDQGVVGMKIRENKTLTLAPAEAYGEVNASLFVSFPINAFRNTTLVVGGRVSNGRSTGTVIAVNATNATVDFNPPLAGNTLVFHVEVVRIWK